MSESTSTTAPAKKESGLKFLAATLLLVGIVTAATQFVAVFAFGIADYVRLESGYGPGLIAATAAIVMGAKCRSWESWRKWIWLPNVIAITLVLVFTGAVAQSMKLDEAVEQRERSQQAQTCQALRQQIDAKAAEIVDLQPKPYSPDGPSWADGVDDPAPPDWDRGARLVAEAENDRLLAEYDAAC